MKVCSFRIYFDPLPALGVAKPPGDVFPPTGDISFDRETTKVILIRGRPINDDA